MFVQERSLAVKKPMLKQPTRNEMNFMRLTTVVPWFPYLVADCVRRHLVQTIYATNV